MAPSDAPLKLAVEASRGASLAVHAAAGLSRGQPQALRLMRVAEGVCRSVVAVLQATEATKGKNNGQRDDFRDYKGNSTKGASWGLSQLVGGGGQTATKSQRRRQRRRAARGASAPPVGEAELDDAWADGVSTPGRPAPPPPRPRSRSGSRSPRRDEVAPAVAAAGAVGLAAGRVATVQGVVSRPDLVGALVLLLAFDEASGRWVARTVGGERLRLLPGRLAVIPGSDQASARLRFEKGVV